MESSDPVLVAGSGECAGDEDELATNEEEIKRQGESISACAWSSDGRFLAVGDLAGSLWIYKEDGERIFSGELPEDWLGISCISFHPDKPCFVLGTEGGRMAVIYIQSMADGTPQVIVASYPSPHVGTSSSYDSEGGSDSEIVWLSFVKNNIVSVSVDGLIQCQPIITKETKNIVQKDSSKINPLASAADHFVYGTVTGLTSININDILTSTGTIITKGQQQHHQQAHQVKGGKREKKVENVKIVTCGLYIDQNPTSPDIIACGCDNGMVYIVHIPTCRVASYINLKTSSLMSERHTTMTGMEAESTKKGGVIKGPSIVSSLDFIVTSAGLPLLCASVSMPSSGTGCFVVRDINHSINRLVLDLPTGTQCSAVAGVYYPTQLGIVRDSVVLGCEDGSIIIINAISGATRVILSEPTPVFALAVYPGDPTYIIAGHESGGVWVYSHGGTPVTTDGKE